MKRQLSIKTLNLLKNEIDATTTVTVISIKTGMLRATKYKLWESWKISNLDVYNYFSLVLSHSYFLLLLAR